MFENLEETITASPEIKKRVSDSILFRQSKRKRNPDTGTCSPFASTSSDSHHLQLPDDFSDNASCTVTEMASATNIYWKEDEETNKTLHGYKIFNVYAEDIIIEKANLADILPKITPLTPRTVSDPDDKSEFRPLSEFQIETGVENESFDTQSKAFSLQLSTELATGCSSIQNDKVEEDLKTHTGFPELEMNNFNSESETISPLITQINKLERNLQIALPGPETQFGISESEFASFCNEAEKLEYCKTPIKLPQSHSIPQTPPLQNTQSHSIQQTPPLQNSKLYNSDVQQIFDDFSELEDRHLESPIFKEQSKLENLTPRFQFRKKPLRTYSGKRTKNNYTINLNTIYESDSSHSSDYYKKIDDIVICLPPIKHDFDETICEEANDDLRNLSSFFLESLSQECGAAVKSSQKFVMKKCKQWIDKDLNWMLEYFKTKRNFVYDRNFTENSGDFEGFEESDDNDSEVLVSERLSVMSQVSESESLHIAHADSDMFSESDADDISIQCTGKISFQYCQDFNTEISAACEQKTLIGNEPELGTDESQIVRPANERMSESDIWNDDDDLLASINTEFYDLCSSDFKDEFKKHKIVETKLSNNQPISGVSVNILAANDNVDNQQWEGFKLASQKPVVVSKEALANAQKFMNQIMKEEMLLEDKENISTSKLSAIKPKNLSEDLNVNELLLDDCFSETINFDVADTEEIPPIISEITDKSKNILKPTDKSTQKASNFLAGIAAEITTNPKAIDAVPPTVGFKTVSGKPIRISAKALAKAQTFINRNNNEITKELTSATNSDDSPIFATQVPVINIPDPQQQLECITNEDNINPTSPSSRNSVRQTNKTTRKSVATEISHPNAIGAGPPTVGFKTVSGKAIKISAKALSKAQTFINRNNDEISKELTSTVNYEDSPIFGTQVPVINTPEPEQQLECITDEENSNPINPSSRNSVRQTKKTTRKSVSSSQSNLRKSQHRKSLEEPRISIESSPARVLRSVLKQKINSTMQPIIDENLLTSKDPKRRKSDSSESTLSSTHTISPPLSQQNVKETNSVTSSSSSTSSINHNKKKLSLSRRRFKPPAIITSSPSQNPNFSTPNRQNHGNFQQTPNLQEFFNSIPNSGETSTPITAQRHQMQLLDTQEITPSTVALMSDQMKNSSIIDDMKIIKWEDNIGDRSSQNNNSGLNLSINNNIILTRHPSPKDRAGRLNMHQKPPNLSPIAFIDTCKPSGLRRNTSMLKKPENKLNFK